MAEVLSDYSKILELQEIKGLYDEQQERHKMELAERDGEIQRLTAQVGQSGAGAGTGGEADQLRGENQRLSGQLERLRQEYEAKIERLNSRIRELSVGGTPPPPAAEPARKGFFRR